MKINELVKLCSEKKIPATSITDFNNLFGSMEFSIECQQSGVQPIIGCNIFLPDVGGDAPQILLLMMTDDDVGTEGNS